MAGGGSQTTTKAEFPPEFRPLATSAVSQIQALQNAQPLASFGTADPQDVAGISPFQQAALNFVPQLFAPSPGVAALHSLLGAESAPLVPGLTPDTLASLQAQLSAPIPQATPVINVGPSNAPQQAPPPQRANIDDAVKQALASAPFVRQSQLHNALFTPYGFRR